MKKQTIYIAGPMTGLPDLNFPTFHTEAARLRSLGHEVINPAEIGGVSRNLVRPRRSVGVTRSHRAVILQSITTNGQGFDVGGFSHLRRSVGHFAEHGYQLQRPAPVGRCHQITPCRHFAEHGHRWARV